MGYESRKKKKYRNRVGNRIKELRLLYRRKQHKPEL